MCLTVSKIYAWKWKYYYDTNLIVGYVWDIVNTILNGRRRWKSVYNFNIITIRYHNLLHISIFNNTTYYSIATCSFVISSSLQWIFIF